MLEPSISVVFLLIVTIFLTFFLIGCESSFHKHEYIKEFIYPTCTEKGYIVYSCKCGDEYNDNYVDELGHTCNDWEIIEESTAITQGIKQGICSRCKENFQEKLPLNNAPNLQGYTIKISFPWILENLFSVGKIFKKNSPYSEVLDEVEKGSRKIINLFLKSSISLILIFHLYKIYRKKPKKS